MITETKSNTSTSRQTVMGKKPVIRMWLVEAMARHQSIQLDVPGIMNDLQNIRPEECIK